MGSFCEIHTGWEGKQKYPTENTIQQRKNDPSLEKWKYQNSIIVWLINAMEPSIGKPCWQPMRFEELFETAIVT